MKRAPRIALVGMYGGMWREYNPGCFLIGYKTVQEIKKRIPEAQVDIYSIDNKSKRRGVHTEKMLGMKIRFFSKKEQRNLLDKTLSKYDALIFGGDIIWGGDDVVADNKIFFLQSSDFLKTQFPVVLFNSVHTFYDDKSIINQRKKFIQVTTRASYVSVRTKAIQDRLSANGIAKPVFVPDPVLDFDPALPKKGKTTKIIKITTKPILGISIRYSLVKELIYLLKNVDLSGYQVIIFSYSRQYSNLKTVHAVEKVFGRQFTYIKKYLDPFQTYRLIGQFDRYITDTYHGVIGAMVNKIQFISIDLEKEKTSRKQQLLDTMKISQRYNIRLGYNDPNNLRILTKNIPNLLKKPIVYNEQLFTGTRKQIQRHFDRMVKIISHN